MGYEPSAAASWARPLSASFQQHLRSEEDSKKKRELGGKSEASVERPQQDIEQNHDAFAGDDIDASESVATGGRDGKGGPEAAVPQSTAAGGRLQMGVAPMRNLYTAALSYNGYTITDGALRLIVLLNAARLGFTAIEIAFMFSMYEIAGVFTNLFGGLAGNKYGLRCTLLTSLCLQITCLVALTQTEYITGNLDDATGSTRLQATIYITAWQALAGVAKDLMKLTGKSTPKLVTNQGAEGKLFQLVAWLTGMKNALKGFGHFLGALLVAEIDYENSLFVLVGICAVFLPVGTFGMDSDLGTSSATKKMKWRALFSKGRQVNLLSGARFFLFGSRDVWFEIGLPLFLKLGLEWNEAFVGLFLAGYIVVYGNLQAASTKLYKKQDGTAGHPTAASAFKWAVWCSLVPLITGIAAYFTFNVAGSKNGTAVVLVIGLMAFAGIFAVNSSVHSYLIVSYSNKDKVSIDLGFYYMANAAGRLVGTLLGGFLYHFTFKDFGLSVCLVVACPFLVAAASVAYLLVPTTAAVGPGIGPSFSTSETCTTEPTLVPTHDVEMFVNDGDQRKSDIETTTQYRVVSRAALLKGVSFHDPDQETKEERQNDLESDRDFSSQTHWRVDPPSAELTHTVPTNGSHSVQPAACEPPHPLPRAPHETKDEREDGHRGEALDIVFPSE